MSHEGGGVTRQDIGTIGNAEKIEFMSTKN